MRVVALIPARRGSKSLVHKNLRTVGGKSLIARAVRACHSSSVSKTLFSTDSELYWQEAWNAAVACYGGDPRLHQDSANVRLFHVERPPVLAEDVPTEDVAVHAVQVYQEMMLEEKWQEPKVGILCTVQPTSPFVTASQIDACIKKLNDNPVAQSCIIVRKVKEHPEWMFRELSVDTSKLSGTLLKSDLDEMVKEAEKHRKAQYLELYEKDFATANVMWTKKGIEGARGIRQNLSELYIPTGGCYATRVDYLMKEKKIIADTTLFVEVPFWQGIDIDDDIDLEVAEALSKKFGL